MLGEYLERQAPMVSLRKWIVFRIAHLSIVEEATMNQSITKVLVTAGLLVTLASGVEDRP